MRHYFWVFAERFGAQFLKIVAIFILARILTPHDVGLYAMVGIVVSIANMLIDSGLSGSLIRKRTLTNADYSTVFIFNLVVALLFYGLAFLLAPVVAGFYNQPELDRLIKVLSVTVIIRSLGLIQITKLTKELRFKSQSFIFILAGVFSLAVAYSMAIQGYGYWALVGQQIAETVFTLLACWLHTRYFPGLRLSMTLLREHFGFGSRLMLAGVAEVIYQNIVVVAAGKSAGAGVAGHYAQAARVSEVFTALATTIVEKTSFPILVRRAEFKPLYLHYAAGLLRSACLISFLGIAILVACASQITHVVLGEQWSDSAWMLQIIALSGYGVMVEAVSRSLLKSQGRSDLILTISIAKGAVSIAVLLLLSLWGIRTLLWGVVVLSGASALLNCYVVSRVIDYRLWQQVKDLLQILGVSLVVIGAVSALAPWVKAPPVAALLLLTGCAMVLYCGLAFFLQIRECQVIRGYLLSQIQQRVPRKTAVPAPAMQPPDAHGRGDDLPSAPPASAALQATSGYTTPS